MFHDTRIGWTALFAAVFALSLARPAGAQELSAVLAGYGSATYDALLADDATPNNFRAQLAPILLFQMGENVMFETELEFEVEGEETETALEYAQVEYLGFERFQLVAGKFLLPFGVFSERLHPTWINKMPSMPLLYGHAHGGVAEGSLLPVLSDAGLMARYAQPAGEEWKLDVSAWVSQGPRLVSAEEAAGDGNAHAIAPVADLVLADGDDDHGGDAAASPFEIPSVSFGTSFGDNNENKMLGARIGFVRGGNFEVYLSGFHAMIDPDDFLDMTGYNVSAEFRRGTFELRGEGALLRQEFIDGEEAYRTVERPGYYVQASRRFGQFEPIVRWSQLLDSTVDDVTVREGIEQLAVGLDYWITPSVPVKVAYAINPDRDDSVRLQWAFGF